MMIKIMLLTAFWALSLGKRIIHDHLILRIPGDQQSHDENTVSIMVTQPVTSKYQPMCRSKRTKPRIFSISANTSSGSFSPLAARLLFSWSGLLAPVITLHTVS